MDESTKRSIVASVDNWIFANINIPLNCACGWYAMKLILELAKHGVRAVFQAGTTEFQVNNNAEGNNAFSYVFEGLDTPRAINSIAIGSLPEMHCWAAIPDTQEIIDLSWKHQASRHKEVNGESWDKSLRLQPYFWGTQKELFAKSRIRNGIMSGSYARYYVNREATMYAFDLFVGAISGQDECRVFSKGAMKELYRDLVDYLAMSYGHHGVESENSAISVHGDDLHGLQRSPA